MRENPISAPDSPPENNSTEPAITPEIARNAAREKALYRYGKVLENEAFQDEAALETVFSQAQNDAVLTQMLCETHDQIAAENSWFAPQNVDEAARQALQSRLQLPVIARPEIVQTLCVADVVRVLERDQEAVATSRPREKSQWSEVLEPLRERRDALPARITTRAMQEFWQKLGVAPSRELAARFTQIARFLAMGQQQNASHMAAARRAESSGLARSLVKVKAAPAPLTSAAMPAPEMAQMAFETDDDSQTPPIEDAGEPRQEPTR